MDDRNMHRIFLDTNIAWNSDTFSTIYRYCEKQYREMQETSFLDYVLGYPKYNIKLENLKAECSDVYSFEYIPSDKSSSDTSQYTSSPSQSPSLSHTTTEDEGEYLTCSEWYEKMKKSSFVDYSRQSEFREFKNKCSYLFTGNNFSN